MITGLTIDDVKSLFEKFIIPYKPYNNDLIYNKMLDTLLSHYLSDSYIEIPKTFKLAYEDQIIPEEFFDYLLLSNGLDTDTLSKLNTKYKKILVYTMLDFVNYKGTIEIIRKIIENFKTNVSKEFNIYELYIDWSNDVQDWCFRPYPILIDNEDTRITEILSFDEIYNRTPRYFINRAQLNDIKENTVFPLKTNILFIDYSKIYNESVLTTLFSYIVLCELKNYRIPVYFTEGIYNMSLLTFVKLWLFIIHYCYKISLGTDYNLSFLNNLLQFNNSDTFCPYQIIKSDKDSRLGIDDLLKEYISADRDPIALLDWYNKYIQDVFQTGMSDCIISLEEYELIVRSEVGDELIDYIISRSNVSSDIQKEIILNEVMSEMMNSLLTYQSFQSEDPRWSYLHYLTELLPLLVIKVEDTAEYAMIKFTKPYHVELLGVSEQRLKIYDNFNAVYNKEIVNYYLQYKKNTLLELSDYLFMSTNLRYDDMLFIISKSKVILNHIIEDIVNIEHKDNHIIISKVRTVLNLLDYVLTNSVNISSDNMLTLNNKKIKINSIINDEMYITYNNIMKQAIHPISYIGISNYYDVNVSNAIP